MALTFKIFGKSEPTIEEIERKFTDLETRRSHKTQEQGQIQQSIAQLKSRVQDTFAEGLLSDDASISRRRKELRDQIPNLQRRHDELSEELEALKALDAVLHSEKAAAIVRKKISEWDERYKTLLPLTKEIVQLFATLGPRLMQATAIVEELHNMTPNRLHYRPFSLWSNLIPALMARYFDGVQISHVPRRIDVHPAYLEQAEFFVDTLEKFCKEWRETLDTPTVEQ
jgi:DNA repair exonuclease SbcCD ATPase subunit